MRERGISPSLYVDERVRTYTCIYTYIYTYTHAYICIYVYICAASSYSSSVGEKERERERGPRRRDRWRKHGGGRETPCFDPRKRRRQSRRVLGSIPQGGRHSAALKPSVYPPSLPPPSRSRSYSSAHSIPRRLSTANLRPISLTFSSSVIRSLFLSLRLPCTRNILLLFLPFSRPPSLFSLYSGVLYEPLFPLSREWEGKGWEIHPRSRSAKLRPPEDRRGWLEDFFVTTGRCCAS